MTDRNLCDWLGDEHNQGVKETLDEIVLLQGGVHLLDAVARSFHDTAASFEKARSAASSRLAALGVHYTPALVGAPAIETVGRDMAGSRFSLAFVTICTY